MDFRLMQQMVSGHNIFVPNPQLTAFPVGLYSTPGLIANPLYQIYAPVHQEKPVNAEKKIVADEEDLSGQIGSGKVEEKPSTSQEAKKRKLGDDIYEKLMHPQFNVRKLQPLTGEGSSKKPKKEKPEKEVKKEKPEKKYHKF
jgi:hypothetical protein